MSRTTSIEIWRMILKYAISVPLFFDTNPAETSGVGQVAHYRREGEYWESERRRNRLRRVCSSWNSFLGRYAHRYVRVVDVWHDRVPLGAIFTAIRVKMDIDTECGCPRCNRLHSNEVEIWMKSLVQEYSQSEPGMWKIEILDLRSNLDITDIKDRMPRLRVILGAAVQDLERLECRDRLETVTMEGYMEVGSGPSIISAIPSLLGLTTLYIVANIAEVEFSPTLALPNLYHLSIKSLSWTSRSSALRLESILRRLGGSLKTFHFADINLGTSIEEDIWNMMPKVEQIQISQWQHLPPPSWHPLRVVQISMTTHTFILDHMPLNHILPGPYHLPEWINEKTLGLLSNGRQMHVKFNWSWLVLLFTDQSNAMLILSMLHLGNMCIAYGIQFTDSDDITLMDYIVFVIKNYWKKTNALLRLHLRDYAAIMPF